ncbi:MAG: hypothetical protein A3E57_07840 [Candidatus Muproteobacteria bacterium RIFCSPHIGHO2_12_FULL_60_33]|uniref:Uncharacterized protein n=1 Tax=Candidatus Muproteobacteria bacterium RIFCSPLOWO2_01_FULL_60_18 TaxID=1817768 RepID=A0A1F6U3T7_9PROT|nr:MAG: hypothetical protein A3A87_08340 [Candidatus Muproteobacteria bacterium RIFCSPLOWO2_01_FULL_60_18]OGI54085.1 MAG: hypothetical protein A3D32_05735 [Candidatus Muproteobacteria bacterium RIFCSPHIGHO2_02_FULL_60_13]OGI54957.1 MAG: hypothetical protein A3E57_07840 [Candidatus Muproteobacteria bacterium RIFCSPHIGHO2_12_FULL_60_33]
MPGLRQLLKWLGPLRLMLALGVLVLLVLRPAPGTPPVYAGWDMISTLIFPVLVPLLFMVLLLDAIMSAVQLASYPGERRRYRTVIGVSLGMALLVALWWWPYFGAILR